MAWVGRVERWLQTGRGRLSSGLGITALCGYFSVSVMLKAAQAMHESGPFHEAPFAPLRVVWALVATWLLAHTDVRSDWGNVVGGMVRRVQDQRRRHQELLAITKHRAEEANQLLQDEKAHLTDLQVENARLLQQQHVLQAELQMALNNYVPSTVIDAGTPADRMLGMIAEMLDGGMPSVEGMLFVQDALLTARDVYQPVDLGKQMQASLLDDDISQMLIQQLGGEDSSITEPPAPTRDEPDMGGTHPAGHPLSDDDDHSDSSSDSPLSGGGGLGGGIGGSRTLSDGSNDAPAVSGPPDQQQRHRRGRRERRRERAAVEGSLSRDGGGGGSGDFGYGAEGLAAAVRAICESTAGLGEGGGALLPADHSAAPSTKGSPRFSLGASAPRSARSFVGRHSSAHALRPYTDGGAAPAAAVAPTSDTLDGSPPLANGVSRSGRSASFTASAAPPTPPRAPTPPLVPTGASSAASFSSRAGSRGASPLPLNTSSLLSPPDVPPAAQRSLSASVPGTAAILVPCTGNAAVNGGGGVGGTGGTGPVSKVLASPGSALHLAALRRTLHTGPQQQQQQQAAVSAGAVVPPSANGKGGAALVPVARIPAPIYEEVEKLLVQSDSWQFDAFALCSATQGHPLSTLAYYLMHTSGCLGRYRLNGVTVARFFRCIEEGYRDNPYHSRTHAANVLQVMHVLMQQGGLVPFYCDPLTTMACYIAAAVHDFEHAGVTNDFLIASNDPLALRYNDHSPHENHHCAAAFQVMGQREYNFLAHLPKADFDRLRKLVIDLVLATDMKQHFAITSQFNTVHRLAIAGGAASRRSGGSPSMSAAGSMRQSMAGDQAGGPGGGTGGHTGTGSVLHSAGGSGNVHPSAGSSDGLMHPPAARRVGSGSGGGMMLGGSITEGRVARFDLRASMEALNSPRNPTPRTNSLRVNARDLSGRDGLLMSADATPGSDSPALLGNHNSSFVNTPRDSQPASEMGSALSASRLTREALVVPVQPLDESERLLSLQMALKCADLGHMAADLPVHIKWVYALEAEMFEQGDKEKARNLPVSPLFDRDKPGVTKSQIGFYEIVVIPLFTNYSRVFPQSKPLLAYVMRDYQHWSALQPPPNVPAPPTAPSTEPPSPR